MSTDPMGDEMYVVVRCIDHIRPIFRDMSKKTLVEFHNAYVADSSTDRAYENDVMWDLLEEGQFHMMFVADGFPSIDALLDLGAVLGVDMVVYKHGHAHAHISIQPYRSRRTTFPVPLPEDVPREELGMFSAKVLACCSSKFEQEAEN